MGGASHRAPCPARAARPRGTPSNTLERYARIPCQHHSVGTEHTWAALERSWRRGRRRRKPCPWHECNRHNECAACSSSPLVYRNLCKRCLDTACSIYAPLCRRFQGSPTLSLHARRGAGGNCSVDKIMDARLGLGGRLGIKAEPRVGAPPVELAAENRKRHGVRHCASTVTVKCIAE